MYGLGGGSGSFSHPTLHLTSTVVAVVCSWYMLGLIPGGRPGVHDLLDKDENIIIRRVHS